MPFSRSAIFAGKWGALAGLTLLSTLVFSLANLLGGLVACLIRPDLGWEFPLPMGELVAGPLVGWLLAMFMLAIHLWLSLRWSSFLVSITVGFAASISNIFIVNSYLLTKSALSPWAMPIQAYGHWQIPLILSLAGAALVCFLAQRQFIRSDVF